MNKLINIALKEKFLIKFLYYRQLAFIPSVKMI